VAINSDHAAGTDSDPSRVATLVDSDLVETAVDSDRVATVNSPADLVAASNSDQAARRCSCKPGSGGCCIGLGSGGGSRLRVVGSGQLGSVGDDGLGYGDGRLGYGGGGVGGSVPEVSAWIESSGATAWRIENRGDKSKGKGTL
jgi:hypothetical protein